MISNRLSGWYYDLQLENRLTCATLHPSMELSQDQSKWEKFKGQEDPDHGEYRKDPLCRAIITEDFNVSVANNWSDFGGDMLGQMWDSLKPLAPYVGVAKQMISSAVKEYDNADAETKKKINESTLSKTLAKVMTALNDTFNDPNAEINIEDYLNRSLVVQGTRFSYYSGSGTSFGNLLMRFTVFPTFKDNKFVTVNEQVEELLPYCIGKYVSGTDGIDKKIKEKETKKLIDDMIGWQKPPGGFRANVRNVDTIQEGTLMLRLGTYYCITNLVVENANFNFSKQMTKNPTANWDIGTAVSIGGSSGKYNDILSPLYCDVTIQLRPATKYSDVSLREFISSRGSTNILEATNNKLKENLNLTGIKTYGINGDLYVY